MRIDSLTPRQLCFSRVRLVIAFAATFSGEILSRVLHGNIPHWICATIVFAVLVSQLYADFQCGKRSLIPYMVPAIIAIAALYVMSINEAFSAPQMEMAHMTGHAHSHSHSHMVCIASEFILIAKYFEKSARFSANETLNTLDELVPESGIIAGELVTVLRSEIFPVDGIIVSGETTTDESAVTGDRKRIPKKAGDSVYCGSVNFDHTVEIKATGSRDDSIYFRRLSFARNSILDGRKGVRSAASHLSTALVFLTLVGGLLAIIITAIVYPHSTHVVIMRMISIAIAATPTAVFLFSPLADTLGFTSLIKNGILLKNAVCAEKLACIQNIYFDSSALTAGNTAERRQGASKTVETLEELGYVISNNPADAIAAASPVVIATGALSSSPVRVAIGKSTEMKVNSADVLITHDKITHLLKAIYVSRILQRDLVLCLAAAVFCNIVVILLSATGILTPVYAGIAAAVVSIGLLANNWFIEKRCQHITFEKLLKYISIRKGHTL